MATCSRLPEVTGFVEGDQEFQLFDIHCHSARHRAGWPILARQYVAWGVDCRWGHWSDGADMRQGAAIVGIRKPKTMQGERVMSLISFLKDAGEKLIDLLTPGNANAGEQLKEHIAKFGLDNPGIQATVEGETVTLKGEVADQATKDKIVMAAGNIAGISGVDDQLTVATGAPAEAPSTFVRVEKGDTLSAISKRVYGDANKYQKIFEANKPMLSHPDKIYPGQTLRIPK
jgi:LysM repeat protein